MKFANHNTFYIRTDLHNRRDILNLRRLYGDRGYAWYLIIVAFLQTLVGNSIDKKFYKAMFLHTDCPEADMDKFLNLLVELELLVLDNNRYILNLNPDEAIGDERHKYPRMRLTRWVDEA